MRRPGFIPSVICPFDGLGPCVGPSLTGARELKAFVGPRGSEMQRCRPVLHATEAVAHTGREWFQVVAIVSASVIALIESDRWGVPLAYSAARVLLVLTGLVSCHVQRDRDCTIALILEGHERLATAPLQRPRNRLLAERTRARVAELEHAGRQVRRARCSVPRFEPPVVGALTDELHKVRWPARRHGCSRSGCVAEPPAGEILSPLSGRDVDALRDSAAAFAGPA